ncbi:MAG: hypothetical protein WC481_07505 [Candidatus Omnitrophota bacterium]
MDIAYWTEWASFANKNNILAEAVEQEEAAIEAEALGDDGTTNRETAKFLRKYAAWKYRDARIGTTV